MTSETTAKKDVQKLQRAIVDGLEDVKGQDIVVFNTEHLSPLFERVIIASGTSNRQTKALAASVRDAVREAGFDKPRIEGEENGEWIIVDCGAAVAHVMQPVIRQYYHLEEIWGEKPVRTKHGATKPETAKPAKPARPSELIGCPRRAPAKPPNAAASKPCPCGVFTKSKSPAITSLPKGPYGVYGASRRLGLRRTAVAVRASGASVLPFAAAVVRLELARPALRTCC